MMNAQKISILTLFISLMSCSPEYTKQVSNNSLNVCVPNKSEVKQVYVRKKPENITIIGDSEACFIKRKTDKDPKYANVDVYCRGGTTVENYEGYGKLKTALLRHKKPIDLIIIMLGANDFWKTRLQNTKPIEEQIKNIPRCIWVGPPKIQGLHWKHTAMLKEYITTQTKCEYVDTEAEDIPLIDWWHPSPKGTDMWLNIIWQKV